MRFETVKSFILWVLIGTSLLLTFALWSYTPNGERLPEDAVEESTDLGGIEESISSLVEPSSIIFKSGDNYFGFKDPSDRQSLYENMQSWTLYEFETSASNGPPSRDNMVEMVFPDAIPMELAGSLFTFNEDNYFPEWQFDRLFLTFNEDSNTLNVSFLSEHGDQEATAVINNSEKYGVLWEYLTTFEGLTEYLRVETTEKPSYIPRHQTNVPSVSVAVQTINSNLMVDILFSNPEIVSPNRIGENEIYYTDNARGIMRVYPNRRTMEFQNPLQSSTELLEPAVLLDQSIMNINDHLGWTDEYNLAELDAEASNNTVRYRLHYNGYPAFGSNYTSTIEQQYRGTELHRYYRPMYTLQNYLGGDESATLPSGMTLVEKLENSTTYNMDNVRHIKIGYDLTYQSDADAVSLDPAWFMDYNGTWQKIDFEDQSWQQGGN
ncbi:Two-component signal transduction system YycFG, regulatory protein YycH [Lentibacillus persicus]|uniref:Two-component signal transduction system YycFG, regulatory protein YycH n=1 Tax=Lentibacillus persicus TaxID=640948 RepID=A0A1I1UIU3_9BACI|nr:two-component system activity regulator YycH [Lentibacillus persicus]SFD70515.1 Two-component signal transduction system YycFG, regulatory protein YycH [Lentibacillus persicus]